MTSSAVEGRRNYEQEPIGLPVIPGIPARGEIQIPLAVWRSWIPAFAGMTSYG
jgi:hypothetical protein